MLNVVRRSNEELLFMGQNPILACAKADADHRSGLFVDMASLAARGESPEVP
jgi:hypothetical protein